MGQILCAIDKPTHPRIHKPYSKRHSPPKAPISEQGSLPKCRKPAGFEHVTPGPGSSEPRFKSGGKVLEEGVGMSENDMFQDRMSLLCETSSFHVPARTQLTRIKYRKCTALINAVNTRWRHLHLQTIDSRIPGSASKSLSEA